MRRDLELEIHIDLVMLELQRWRDLVKVSNVPRFASSNVQRLASSNARFSAINAQRFTASNAQRFSHSFKCAVLTKLVPVIWI